MYIDSIVCDKQTLSVFLKSVLHASNIQQKVLASRLGVDPSNVSKWFNGSNMTLGSFFDLLNIMNIQCILVYDDTLSVIPSSVVPSIPLPYDSGEQQI